VQAVVDADLLASRNPLIVTGFVGLDSLLGFLASVRSSTESVRLLLGHKPYAAGKTVFRVGQERFADEIADYWLERGVSLYRTTGTVEKGRPVRREIVRLLRLMPDGVATP
jgi:hypothetical protein